MNKDNFSALLTGIGVVALIVGFAVYFNNPKINTISFGNSNDNFVPAVSVRQQNRSNNQVTVTVLINLNSKKPQNLRA